MAWGPYVRKPRFWDPMGHEVKISVSHFVPHLANSAVYAMVAGAAKRITDSSGGASTGVASAGSTAPPGDASLSLGEVGRTKPEVEYIVEIDDESAVPTAKLTLEEQAVTLQHLMSH